MQSINTQRLTELEARKLVRGRLGLSQEKIAARLGVSETFYNYWENGKRTSAPLKAKFYTLYRQTYRRNQRTTR